jgi:hypothetical protein
MRCWPRPRLLRAMLRRRPRRRGGLAAAECAARARSGSCQPDS